MEETAKQGPQDQTDRSVEQLQPAAAPTEEDTAGRRKKGRSRRLRPPAMGWWVVAVFLALLFLLALRAYLGVEGLFREVGSLPRQIVDQWKTSLPAAPTPTVVVLPPVVEQVQSMARLQTTSYFLSTVVEAERPAGWPGTGQRLLLVAYGKVTAGVDLSLLTESNVQVVGKRVVIKLPDAEVFDTFLDEEGTYVYDYEKGIFARYDATLESQARQRALEEFENTALENGILEDARRRAEWEVQRLLLLLGYEVVDFR